MSLSELGPSRDALGMLWRSPPRRTIAWLSHGRRGARLVNLASARGTAQEQVAAGVCWMRQRAQHGGPSMAAAVSRGGAQAREVHQAEPGISREIVPNSTTFRKVSK